MSMSRHAIKELLQKMQALSETVTHLNYPDKPTTGALTYLQQQLDGEEGAPTIRLRHMGQLVKHYWEQLQTKPGRAKPAVVFAQLDEAMRLFWVHLYDVQMSIRHARNAVRVASNPELVPKPLPMVALFSEKGPKPPKLFQTLEDCFSDG